jgi:uncharacterized membrane protein
MGLREIEEAFMLKLSAHAVVAITMGLWIVYHERQLRYHRLLLYLAGVSLVMSIVVSFD